MMASSDWWTRYFKLKDRFGDSGLVGVMVAETAPRGGRWRIDTWAMSCRVIGRRLEDLMLRHVWEAARAAGAKELEGRYVPSARNGMVADLYDRLGFIRQVITKSDEVVYAVDLASCNPPDVDFIRETRA
mgnify:CR=1 FL=1